MYCRLQGGMGPRRRLGAAQRMDGKALLHGQMV